MVNKKQSENGSRPAVNFKYKAGLFEMIFSRKEELLELYNAVNGSHYTDPGLLEINTLENAVYMSIKNDISFILGTQLSLYEHQSTWNPNLPLRYLEYIADLYSALTKEAPVYGSKPIRLPTPEFIIFYNGSEEQPDRKTLKLSDLYTIHKEKPALELEAVMLNINRGHNQELMDACRTLKDYSEYIARVREYSKEVPIEYAVEKAVTECIHENILADFLSRYRAEAIKVSIYEYDAEKHIRQEREESYQTGFSEGRETGIKFAKSIFQLQKKGMSVSEIAREQNISEEKVKEILEQ